MTNNELIPEPAVRTLRIFAFDPSVSAQYDLAAISEITISVPWENLEPGPVGEYLQIVDVDPASGVAYKPVDLNDPKILAQDGLAPSEGNPQFHQQMVYAVAMATISQFEQALGRVALWSYHRKYFEEGIGPGAQSTSAAKEDDAPADSNGDEKGQKSKVKEKKQFVRRLRVYPHALRDRNAYYSPKKKALLFGYFPVGIKSKDNVPGTLVFSCLSHDIIAHETTHALLDGVHPRFNEPVNVDVHAFHEAFADIVAMFQHFSYPGILRDQIGRTRGNLGTENMLGQLAQQFGKATGRGEALRDALGGKNDKGVWVPRPPDVRALDKLTEPHARGAILVAAVFGAFLKVYQARTADLMRIATEGTGVLREGEIHPDLANRLASEASRTAQQVLQMCIRALDYCPPVGITFGDYLRAIVTADADFNPDDPNSLRLAITESFRQWGINPDGLRHTSVESLLWPTGESLAAEYLTREDLEPSPREGAPKRNPTSEEIIEAYRDIVATLYGYSQHPRKYAAGGTFSGTGDGGGRKKKNLLTPWSLDTDRYDTWRGVAKNATEFWIWLIKRGGDRLAGMIGLVLDKNAPPSVYRSTAMPGTIAVEVHSVRTAVRRSARGAPVSDLVVEITQRRRGYFDRQKQLDVDNKKIPVSDGDFKYRAGCTLIISQSTMDIRRVIRTPGTITDNDQLERQRRFLTGEGLQPHNAFDKAAAALQSDEPFAMLHRYEEDSENGQENQP